jgi:quercetin dioxygenase-like cupin family protein
MYPLPDLSNKVDLPERFIVEAAGIFFASIILPKGIVVGQHSHDHAHATFIGSGLVRGWKGDAWMGDKGPGEAFEVEAGATHCYLALETALLACTHDVESALSVKKKGI